MGGDASRTWRIRPRAAGIPCRLRRLGILGRRRGVCAIDRRKSHEARSEPSLHGGARAKLWDRAAGRLRQRFPDASVYNHLCDVEWNTPVGDANECGGIAIMRVRAFEAVGGFIPGLIAGEETELCVGLRQAGWKIRRLDTVMTLHNVAMSRFSRWWKRTVRAGHAYAEGAYLHGTPPERMGARKSRRIVAWGLLFPALAIAALDTRLLPDARQAPRSNGLAPLPARQADRQARKAHRIQSSPNGAGLLTRC